ncbi:SDR family NAD(P)-dependent oxidoreductase [Georgenia sp. AZ-5]|uniref:SDR family NAD(P)-dependent oxidoreductase n=1 Tax=Georgenia sp. AZ-5 TaxID=3367526 RepID=UPI003754C66B
MDLQLDFEGRVALVTGAGSGMGRAYAQMLASRGARVVVNDINGAAAAATVEAIEEAGGQAVADAHDICVDAAKIVQSAIDNYGSLAIVINNAGIVRFGLFAEQDPATWWRTFDIHVRGTVEISRYAWPHLASSGSGRLINTASTGMLPGANRSSYGAAKGAIWGLGNSLFEEGREAGIQVSTILPASWTPMTESSFDVAEVRDTMRDLMPPDAVAAFVTWLAHQDTTVFGQSFQISGNAANRTALAATPRITAARSTPEAWVEAGTNLIADAPMTPYKTSGESLRNELVFHNPALAEILSTNSVSIRAK